MVTSLSVRQAKGANAAEAALRAQGDHPEAETVSCQRNQSRTGRINRRATQIDTASTSRSNVTSGYFPLPVMSH